MSGNKKIIHRVSVNTGQPMVVPPRGTFALRRSRLVRRRFQQIFYTAGLILSMGAIGQAGYGFVMEIPYFTIKAPTITGVSEPLRQEIEGLVRSLTTNDSNILNINTADLEQQIARHPRVRDIRVVKTYPDRLQITAVERREVAIAITGNGSFLVDNDGHVMDKLELKDLKDMTYPFISGLLTEEVHEGEPIDSISLSKALNLLQVLEARNPSLYAAISDIQIKDDRVSPLETLTAHMKSGLEIRFGDQNPIDKLPALETLLKKLQDEGVEPFENLAYIDMRFKDMAFYMDKDTALDIAQLNYDELLRGMEKATEKYQAEHPMDKLTDQSSSSSKKPSSDNTDTAKQPSPRKNSAAATPRNPARAAARAAQPQVGYNNYGQPSQQYAPQQYYQQRQTPQMRQSAPLYNLPANQPR